MAVYQRLQGRFKNLNQHNNEIEQRKGKLNKNQNQNQIGRGKGRRKRRKGKGKENIININKGNLKYYTQKKGSERKVITDDTDKIIPKRMSTKSKKTDKSQKRGKKIYKYGQ